MSLTLTREALSNQIADDLATRNTNAGLIEVAVNEKAESADVYTKTENDSLLGSKESIENVNVLKGDGWTTESVKGNADAIATKLNKDIPYVSVTASKTLGLTDASTLQVCNSASLITVTIPTNAVTAFPVGTEIVITRYGVGAVIIAGDVTIQSSYGMKSINPQYGAVSLYKVGTDEWLLIGALSE